MSNSNAAYVAVIVAAVVIWFLLNRWFDARDKDRPCGERMQGWTCNRAEGHPGHHEFFHPGTGMGDDKIVTWGDHDV